MIDPPASSGPTSPFAVSAPTIPVIDPFQLCEPTLASIPIHTTVTMSRDQMHKP